MFKSSTIAPILAIICLWPSSIKAQGAITSGMGLPPVTQGRIATSAEVPYTPDAWEHAANIAWGQATDDQQIDVAIFPRDSIKASLSEQIKGWLNKLDAGELKGIHADAYGNLLVMSDQEEAARRTFDERLRCPGMTTADSGFTLVTAVKAFADPYAPHRIQVAEDYMRRLNILGQDANIWKYEGHRKLSQVYFSFGNKDAMVSHAMQAIELVPHLFFRTRVLFYLGGNRMYLATYDVLRKMPDGAERIKAIDKLLLDATVPPPGLVAMDSSFVWDGFTYRRIIQNTMNLAAMLGKLAPVVQGTSWINAPDTGSHQMSLNDGTVRMIGIGGRTDGLYYLPAFERVLKSAGDGAQSVFLVSSAGYWGSKFVTPKVETDSLRKYFTVNRPSRLPIAIWAGAKEPTMDGGLKPKESPTAKAFKVTQPPLIALIDRQGTIRHIFRGFSREEEGEVVAAIKNLLQETR